MSHSSLRRKGLAFLGLALLSFPAPVWSQIKTEVVGKPQFYMDEALAITGVTDQEQALYQAQLAGVFSVKIRGLKPGTYKVTVGNAELSSDSPDYRIFHIGANGKTVVEKLNLNQQFGFAKKGDVSFMAAAEEGNLQIDFLPDPQHDQPRMSFLRVYDAEGKLVAEETALSHKSKHWKAERNAIALLPDVLLTFPKENPARAFPELKVYDAAGHPWRVAKENWVGARQKMESDPAWKKWIAQQRETVDRWMARHPQDRVAWACGWYHDFISPKDGSFLDWSDQIPGEEAPYLHSPSDPKVEITPKIMAAWVFHFRTKHSVMMQTAAALYRVTGEEKYAAWAAHQLDFYADHFNEWTGGRDWRYGAKLYWQTLDEATSLTRYTECARWIGDYAQPERRQKWKEKFFYPEAEMLNRTFKKIHNIATWHRCAAAQVALLFQDDALWKESVDGEFGLRRQLASGVTSDYMWWEQSFGYNYYWLTAVLTLFKTAGIEGRAAELSTEMEIAENLMLSLVYLRFPDGSLPTPADATHLESAPNVPLFVSAYRVFPTTLGLSKAAERFNWDTLVDPPSTVTAAPVLPEVKSHNLESARMALLKSGPWQLFFHYGQLTSSHAQAELLNFSAYYRNVDITHDPGTVGYGSPMHKGYYSRGLNHNVPLVDGEGAYALPQNGVLNEYSDSLARVSATLPAYRPGIVAGRVLQIEGDKLMDVTTLKVSDGKSRKLGLALHLQGKVRLPGNFKEDTTFAVDRPEPFVYWNDVKKASYQDKAEFDVAYGSTTMRVTLSVPGPFTLWHGSTPDVPPKRRDGFYVETTGVAATFTTTFAPVTVPVATTAP